MLAQIETIQGVSEVRVDWTGRYFLVRHSPSVEPTAVVECVAKILGPTTRRLPAKQEEEQLRSFREGAPWLKAGETARLSKHEAETLATRYATTAAQALGLDATRTSKVVAIVREELVAMFKRFESTGLPARAEMMEAWKQMSERVAARSRDSLTESEAERLGEALQACCER